MSIVWLGVERVNPPTWFLRVGRRWYLATRVTVEVPMVTYRNSRQPRMVLRGEGHVAWHGSAATISALARPVGRSPMTMMRHIALIRQGSPAPEEKVSRKPPSTS